MLYLQLATQGPLLVLLLVMRNDGIPYGTRLCLWIISKLPTHKSRLRQMIKHSGALLEIWQVFYLSTAVPWFSAVQLSPLQLPSLLGSKAKRTDTLATHQGRILEGMTIGGYPDCSNFRSKATQRPTPVEPS